MMEIPVTTTLREKFSSQASPEVLAALRQIAESQGRQFQAVLDEAMRDYIDRQQKERPPASRYGHIRLKPGGVRQPLPRTREVGYAARLPNGGGCPWHAFSADTAVWW